MTEECHFTIDMCIEITIQDLTKRTKELIHFDESTLIPFIKDLNCLLREYFVVLLGANAFHEKDGNTIWTEEKKLSTMLLILHENCLLYTSPSPRDRQKSRMPSSA